MDGRPPLPRAARIAAEVLTLAVVFGLLLVYTARSHYEIDVFWHVRTGEWIVQHGTLPAVDTFSAVAPDRPWTPFQWLYEVLVYGLDELGGLTLLRWSHAVLYLVGFALLYLAVRRVLRPVPALFVLLFLIVLLEDRFRVRPEVFNLLFLAVLLPVLFGSWRTIGWRGRLGVGAVAWLWANIHAGGALLVPVTLGGILAGSAFRLAVTPAVAPAGGEGGGWWARRDPARRDEVRRALVLSAVAVLPMLVMPGFLKGVYTAVSMYDASQTLIPEWRPPTAYFDLLGERGVPHYLVCGFAPYVVMVVYGVTTVVRVLRRQIASLPWAEIAMAALLLYLSQRSLRFVFLAIVPVVFLLRDLAARVAAAPAVWPRRAVVAALALASAGCFAVSWHYNIVVQRGSLGAAIERLGDELEPSRFPVEATEFLREAQVEGGILHLSKWGGYLLYYLWPRCSVFSDGRGNFDLVQVGALVATHRPQTRETTLEAAWLLYGLDIVMFPAPVFPLERWEHRRWVRIYAGVEYNLPIEVFLRNSPDNQENLRRVRAWYAALPDPDPRLRSPDLATLEQGIAEYWGRRWLSAPGQQRRLAKLAVEVGHDRDPAERAYALFRRAMVYYNANDVDHAFADLALAQRTVPGDPRVLYYLGWTLYRQGREREALGALAAAARVDVQAGGRLRADERLRGELLLRDLLSRNPPPAGPGHPGGIPPN